MLEEQVELEAWIPQYSLYLRDCHLGCDTFIPRWWDIGNAIAHCLLLFAWKKYQVFLRCSVQMEKRHQNPHCTFPLSQTSMLRSAVWCVTLYKTLQIHQLHQHITCSVVSTRDRKVQLTQHSFKRLTKWKKKIEIIIWDSPEVENILQRQNCPQPLNVGLLLHLLGTLYLTQGNGLHATQHPNQLGSIAML